MPETWPDIRVPIIGPYLTSLVGVPLIHIAGEGTFEISITNALITMWIVMAVLVGVSWLVTRDLRLIPGHRQNFVELLVQGLADFVQSTGGPGALRYFPLFGTLFLFILVSNWLSVVPFVGQIELLHSPTADYHVNFGLAIIGWVAYQSEGIGKLGGSYFKKFFNVSGFKEGAFLGAILFFVGLIELFSELFRMLTLTLRLWGNVLGGEIMLGVMAAVLAFVAAPLALPFVGLELFIGLIQALIFSLLVLMYFILAIESHEERVTGETHEGETQKEVAHA